MKMSQYKERNWLKLLATVSVVAVFTAVSGCAALDAAKRNIIGEDEPEEAGIPDEADEFDTYRQHVTLYPEQDLQTREAWLKSLGHDPSGTAVQQPGQPQQNKPQMTPEQVRAQMTRGLVGVPDPQRQYSNETIRRQDQGDQGVNIPDPNARPVMSDSLRPQQPPQPQAVPLPPGSAAAAVTPAQPAPPPQAQQQTQQQTQQAPAQQQSNYAAPPPTAQPDANQLQKMFADRLNESGTTSVAPQEQQQQQQQQQQQSQPQSEPQARRAAPPPQQQQARVNTPAPAPKAAPRPPVEAAKASPAKPAEPKPEPARAASSSPAPGAQMASAGPATDAGDEASIAHLKMRRPVDSVYVGSVQFTNGSDDLSSVGKDMLKQVLQLHESRGGKVRVVGHPTYGTGSGQGQLALAKDRAEKVRGQLITLGLDPEKIVVEAKDGSEFRAEANNRAEIFID